MAASTDSTSVRRSSLLVIPASAPLLDCVPWLWHDYVVARTRLPVWALGLLVFIVVYGVGMSSPRSQAT